MLVVYYCTISGLYCNSSAFVVESQRSNLRDARDQKFQSNLGCIPLKHVSTAPFLPVLLVKQFSGRLYYMF